MDYGALLQLGSAAVQGAGSAESASAQKGALTNFQPILYKPADVTAGQTQFLSQGAQLGSVADLLATANRQDNAAYQKSVEAIDPSVAAGISNIDQKANDAANGVIAPDVQTKLDRDSAYAALQGGYGGGSGMQDAQQQVNTAKYRLNEQTTTAPALQQQAFQYSSALNPTESNVADTLLSPAALLQRQDQENQYNNQIANQQEVLDAQAAAAKGNILMGTNTPSSGGGSPLGGL